MTTPYVTKDDYLRKVYDNYLQGNTLNVDELIQHYLNKNVSNPTKISMISKFKGILKQIRKSPELDVLFLPKDIRDEVKQLNIDSFNNRQTIKIKRSLVRKLLKLLKSDDYPQIYIGLLLASGRRISELLNLDLIKHDKKSILFRGQLKSKTKEEYIVPLLCSFDAFQKAFYRANEKSQGLPEKRIQDKIRLALLVETRNKEITVHSLRAIYSTELYERSDKIELRSNFFRDILGHSSSTVSIHYDRVNFI